MKPKPTSHFAVFASRLVSVSFCSISLLLAPLFFNLYPSSTVKAQAAGQSQSTVTTAPTSDCTNDTWTPISTAGSPVGRSGHTSVWTGSEMIVWGGSNNNYVNTGGRYNPVSDTWRPTSIGPFRRGAHTAVWTGNEMIIWGGKYGAPDYLNIGDRYDPSADTWTPTTVSGAPTLRGWHTAVWTGSEMIIWGGSNIDDIFNTGGKYDPSTNTWISTSTTDAPIARAFHTAVWTGSEMIVWGGTGSNVSNTGGRYNPVTDTWTPTSTLNAPSGRSGHSVVWTGSEMSVWGGLINNALSNTGGRYNPGTDSWTTVSMTNVPTAREFHTAVWTGSEMIIWGGYGGVPPDLETGGRYNPATDTWTPTSLPSVPLSLAGRGVWTGSEMIVWGGNLDTVTGGRYCAQLPSPTPTPTPSPSPTPGCVFGHGYWMNNPQGWCMETVQIGCQTYTQSEAIAIMRHNSGQDKTYTLAQQLIAAKLSISCKNSNSDCVATAITTADSFLCAHPVGSGVTANSSVWQAVKATHAALAKYNDGTLCAPSCGARP